MGGSDDIDDVEENIAFTAVDGCDSENNYSSVKLRNSGEEGCETTNRGVADGRVELPDIDDVALGDAAPRHVLNGLAGAEAEPKDVRRDHLDPGCRRAGDQGPVGSAHGSVVHEDVDP